MEIKNCISPDTVARLLDLGHTINYSRYGQPAHSDVGGWSVLRLLRPRTTRCWYCWGRLKQTGSNEHALRDLRAS